MKIGDKVKTANNRVGYIYNESEKGDIYKYKIVYTDVKPSITHYGYFALHELELLNEERD